MPQLTETVNTRTGLIRVSGHLTALGADLLSGTADTLRGSGHTRVTLDLTDVHDGDDDGWVALRELGLEFAAHGGELVVRRSPPVA
jgi:anti-anti-sigma regulatory factor